MQASDGCIPLVVLV